MAGTLYFRRFHPDHSRRNSFWSGAPLSQPRLLQRVFAEGGKGLAQILNRAEALSELNRRLQRQLPPSLAGHVIVANMREGILVLQTPSAEWRTRLHFLGPQLLEAMRAEVPTIAELRIRVIPARTQPKTVHPEGQKLSTASADILAKTAAAIDDPGLREVLGRLATRFNR